MAERVRESKREGVGGAENKREQEKESTRHTGRREFSTEMFVSTSEEREKRDGRDSAEECPGEARAAGDGVFSSRRVCEGVRGSGEPGDSA